MEYTKSIMDVIELEVEDVVLTSSCGTQACPDDWEEEYCPTQL